MISNLDMNGLCKFLVKYRNKRVLVTFHTVGDRDAVSSAVAISRVFTNVKIVTPDFITNNARHMLVQADSHKKITKLSKPAADLIVATDSNNFQNFGHAKDLITGFKGDVLFIDHHLKQKYLERDAYVFNDERYNSTASIVFEVLKALGAGVDKSTALLLLNGIISDSAEFMNATPLTFRQISELLELAGTQYSEVLEFFRARISTESRMDMLREMQQASIEIDGDYILAYGRTSTQAASTVADYMLKLGVDAAVFWSITSTEVSISGRLRAPLDERLHIHLGATMQGVKDMLKGNGGGHPCAAGAYGPNKAMAQQAIDRILSEIRDRFKYEA